MLTHALRILPRRPRAAAIPCGLVAFLLLAAASPVFADVPAVYDSEFAGYVPIVDGIQRPDLAAVEGRGRVPTDERDAERQARRELRRALRRGSTIPAELLPRSTPPDERTSWWWRRADAVRTELLVVDAEERPVRGARVFRFYDPWFYAVNAAEDGARLVGILRFLPVPNPPDAVVDLVRRLEPTWVDDGYTAVRARHPEIDALDHPFDGPPVELVGTTDENGELRSISGVFDLRDEDRFPRAIVPGAIRIGFVIVADGYEPAVSVERFREGGERETRLVRLQRGPGHAIFATREFETMKQLAASFVATETDEGLEPLLARLDGLAARAADVDTPFVQRLGRVRLLEAAYRNAPEAKRLPLARRIAAVAHDDPARVHRLAAELAATEGASERVLLRADPVPAPPRLREAEELLRRTLELDPGFLPATKLLDALLARRGASDRDRLRVLRPALAHGPFVPWLRARLAAVELRRDDRFRAYDHLRYTRITVPGAGGEPELARELADHLWRDGLVEKAGFWPFIATGRSPEDPVRRPRRRR
jgi:hypothetical protein